MERTGTVCSLSYIPQCNIIGSQSSEALVQAHTQSLFNSSEDAMSKKIKLQDLSISNFDQQPDVEGIKGGYCQDQWYPKCERNKYGFTNCWIQRKTICWTKTKGGSY